MANENGLNPVIYYSHSSTLLRKIIEEFDQYNISEPSRDTIDFDFYMNLLSYSKNYEGNLKTKKIEKAHYRFSDEREWRFIPEPNLLKDLGAPTNISPEKYENNKSYWNSKLDNIRLKLKARDIKYIIIRDESELKQTINFIKSFLKRKYPTLQDKLISRIFTSEQILSDL